MNRVSRRSARWLLAGLFLLLVGPALACNVPVFRYALERWQADPYDVTIYHRGPLSAEDRAVVDLLERSAAASGPRANLTVELVDLAKQKVDLTRGLFGSWVKPELPWMVAGFPLAARNNATIWSGRLDLDVAKALIDSPVRREVVKRIGSGETAVWLLLESGNESKDDAAAKLLQGRLDQLRKLLKLPELTDSPEDRVSTDGPPLKVAFSVLRVSRQDPAERLLVPMLLNSEEDLLDKDEPMAFPVFGRGRALWALLGKGINDDTIEESGAFLVGPCSCQVKRLNPGTDLLMTADWDALLEGRRIVKDPQAPPLRGIFDLLESIESLPVPPRVLDTVASSARTTDPEPPPFEPAEFVPVPPKVVYQGRLGPADAASHRSTPGEPAPARDSSLVLLRNIGLAVLLGLGAVAAVTLFFRGKGTRSV